MPKDHVFILFSIAIHKIKGPGQVGLYELPTAISQSTQKYDFSLIM